MKIRMLAAVVAVIALCMAIAGCGGGGKTGPTTRWTIRNSYGKFSGVTAARFGCQAQDRAGNMIVARYTVLNQDSSTAQFSQSLGKPNIPSGQDFVIYLPTTWQDFDGDGWPDSSENLRYWWRSTGYSFYFMVYGLSSFEYPGWNRWYGWYSTYDVFHAACVGSIEGEIEGMIETNYYSSRAEGEENGFTVDLDQLTKAVEKAGE